MERGVLSLITTLISNVFVILIVLIYLYFRKKRNFTGTQMVHSSITSTLSQVYSITITEISVAGGQDAYNYLTLLKTLCLLLLLYSLIALLSLVPVYESQNLPHSTSLSQLSIEGMQSDDLSLLIPAMVSIFFSIGCYFVAYMYYKLKDHTPEHFPRFEDMQEEYRRQCTVMVYGIPKSLSPTHLEPVFKERIEAFSIGNVISAKVIPEIKGVDSIIKDKIHAEQNMKVEKLLDEDQNDKHISTLKFEISKENLSDRNAGFGFVLCKQPMISSFIVSTFEAMESMGVGMDKWKIKEAPLYSDILWKNSPSTEVAGMFTKVVLNILFVLIFLILLTPLALVGVVIGLLKDLHLQQKSTSFLTFSLPSLFTSLFYSIIIPMSIKYLVDQERHFLYSKATSNAFLKYIGYCIGILIFFPLLEAITLESVVQKLSKVDFSMWNITLVTNIVKVGEFYVNFILSMSLGSNFLDLAITNQYFLWDFFVYRRSYQFKTAPVFDFAYEYSRVLIILCITLVFSISMPMILPFGCLFMTVKYWLDKYNLLYVYRVEPGPGTFMQGTVLFYLLMVISVSQGINSGIFLASGFDILVYIGGFLSVASFLTALYSFLIFKYRSPFNPSRSFEITEKDNYYDLIYSHLYL